MYTHTQREVNYPYHTTMNANVLAAIRKPPAYYGRKGVALIWAYEHHRSRVEALLLVVF